MTGATGDLTPDDADSPFIPAEQRVISGGELPASTEENLEPLTGGAAPGDDDGDELSDHDERF